MKTANLAAVEAAQAKLRQLEVDRAARPHCTIRGSVLAMTLRSLAEVFEQDSAGNSVIVAFDGQWLSFECNELKVTVVAVGIAWPSRYKLSKATIADVLPVRLKRSEVEVGIWKSVLEIGGARCPGVTKVK